MYKFKKKPAVYELMTEVSSERFNPLRYAVMGLFWERNTLNFIV